MAMKEIKTVEQFSARDEAGNLYDVCVDQEFDRDRSG